MKNNLKSITFYVILIVAILVAVSVILGGTKKAEVNYSDLTELFQTEQVKEFEVDGKNKVIITTQDGREIKYGLRDFAVFYNDFRELILAQKEAGIIQKYNYAPVDSIPWWLNFLPYLLLMLLMGFVTFYMIRQANGGGKIATFGRAKAKMGIDEKKKVLFKDVAGADEEKEELKEVVEFLKNPTKYTKLGARIPHGVLLVGPPGTGKTLLAKAVAGEAGVPFFSISGSDFVEMYVGVGASRVRDLFDSAKKHPAAIIFIDEIDAVGRHRGAGLGGGHDEREQTLNQLLVEMDGFGSGDGTIVIAATNRPDILDPALLRPGRFDRQITVNYPDIRGREDILKVHSKNKPFEEDVDLSVIAKATVGFTGADLANLLNEAALLAARKGKSLIGMPDIEEAFEKVILGGPKKRSRKIKEEEKRSTAYHEAGHAILGKLVMKNHTIHQISIIPAGRAGGYTLNRPNEDIYYHSKTDMENSIVMTMGGRAAEMIIYKQINTGASGDIQSATNTARSMVTRYGMSEVLGSVVYGSAHSADEVFLGRDFSSGKEYSEQTAATIDAEIKRIVDEAYAKAIRLLEENIDKLHLVAEYLVRNEIMDADAFNMAMEQDVTIEELERIEAEKRERSDAANREKAKAVAEEEEALRKQEEAERAQKEARHQNDYDSGLDAYAESQNEENENSDENDSDSGSVDS